MCCSPFPLLIISVGLYSAPTASGLCEKFSCRTVVFIGGLLCCLGLSLSFFATNLSQLCLTFGVLTGNSAEFTVSYRTSVYWTSSAQTEFRSLNFRTCYILRLTGLGGGLSTTPGIIMTSRYFSKHRALVIISIIFGLTCGKKCNH